MFLMLPPVAQITLRALQPLLRSLSDIPDVREPFGYRGEPLPVVLGAMESIIYPVAWIAGFPQFIAFWLVLKLVGNWRGFSTDPGGRQRIQIHLINSLANAAFSTAAYGLMLGFEIVKPFTRS
jgi:hypothetical protein